MVSKGSSLIDVSELRLSLRGQEHFHQTYMGMSEVELLPFCNIQLKIADIAQDNIAFTYERYPFVLQIPDWLPSSLVLASNINSTEIIVEYFLIAEFIPLLSIHYIDTSLTPPPFKLNMRHDTRWPGQPTMLSKLHTARLIHIY